MHSLPSASGESQTPLALRAREAAAMLGISERTLFDLRKAGHVRATVLGPRSVVYRLRELERFLDERDRAGGVGMAPGSRGER